MESCRKTLKGLDASLANLHNERKSVELQIEEKGRELVEMNQKYAELEKEYEPIAIKLAVPHLKGWHYEAEYGWLFVEVGSYPYVFSQRTDSWIYYKQGSHQPWEYFDYPSQKMDPMAVKLPRTSGNQTIRLDPSKKSGTVISLDDNLFEGSDPNRLTDFKVHGDRSERFEFLVGNFSINNNQLTHCLEQFISFHWLSNIPQGRGKVPKLQFVDINGKGNLLYASGNLDR